MAIGFRARKASGDYKYIWLYKVKFAVPSENYATKGDSIEFATPEIVGTIMKRPDGKWKAEHVAKPTESAAQSWFTKVREEKSGSIKEIEGRKGELPAAQRGIPLYFAMSAFKDGRYPINLDQERHLLFSLNAMDEIQDKFGDLGSWTR